MSIGNRIKRLRKEVLNISNQGDLAGRLGFESAQAVSQWETDKTQPSLDVLGRLIGITLAESGRTVNSNWLITGTGPMFLDSNDVPEEPMTVREPRTPVNDQPVPRPKIPLYRLEALERLWDDFKEYSVTHSRDADSVPILNVVPAGFDAIEDDQVQGWLRIPGIGPKSFALRVQGDSMDDRTDESPHGTGECIKHGDLVVVEETVPEFARDGKIYAMVYDGKTTIKRIRVYSDHWTLVSANPKYGVEKVSEIQHIFKVQVHINNR